MSVKDFEKLRVEAACGVEENPFLQALSRGMLKVSRNFEIPFLLLCAIGPIRQHFFSVTAETLLSIFAMLCLGLALVLRMWAKGYAKEQSFVVDGPYRYVRNPVEISTLLGFFGVSWVLAQEFWFMGLSMLLSLFWMSFVSKAAERQLYLSLGPVFLKYQSRVRRWFPSLLPEFNRGGVFFSLRRALREERSVLVWVSVVAAIYALRRGSW